jgi:hypothetical protein
MTLERTCAMVAIGVVMTAITLALLVAMMAMLYSAAMRDV